MNDNMICIPASFLSELPNDRPYTRLEATFSYLLDVKFHRAKTVSGYAKLWQWDRKKVRKFIAVIPQAAPQNLPRQLPTFGDEKQSLTNKAPQAAPQNLPTERDATLKDLSLNSSSLGDPISSNQRSQDARAYDRLDERQKRRVAFARKLYEDVWLPVCAKQGRGQSFTMGEAEKNAAIEVGKMCNGNFEQASRVVKIYSTWKTKEGEYRAFKWLPQFYNDVLATIPPARVIEMPQEPAPRPDLIAIAAMARKQLGLEAKA